MQKQTIALVDDDRNILTSLSIALEKEGFKVQTYIDGESALIGLTRTPPDLAIIDIKMPKMDGEELLKKLRKKTSLPVIFLTSKDEEVDELLGLKLGADDFVKKSGGFSIKVLIERIRVQLRKKNIKFLSSFDSIEGELSTPTGIALLSNLVDYQELPSKYSINSYGVGIGNLKFPFPNLVRVYKITSFEDSSINEQINPKCEEISVQEAWIDDQTPEDISNFVEKLRIEGAYDVSYQAINMKKNRIGFSLQAILPTDKKEYFRRLWFDYSNTIGVRERNQSRWILLRRRGECSTNFGNIKVKQTLKPDGSINMKPENDEVLRLKLKHKISTYEIRKIIKESSKKFKAFENWK